MMNTVKYGRLSLIIGLVIGLLPLSAAGAVYSCVELPPHLQKKPLSLVELSDIALSCHPSTRLTWAQSKAAWANLGIADSVFWPQISGLASYNDNSLRPHGGGTVHQYSSAAGFSLNFLVWDFGVSWSKAKAAQLQWRAALFNQSYALQQVILTLEQTYYSLIGQKDVVISSIQSVKEAKANLDAANAMRDQGVATIGDVYQSKSALLQAELALLQAEGTLKILEGQLLTNLGLPIKIPLNVAVVSDNFQTRPILESTECLMEYANHHRPDLLAAKAQFEASDAQLLAVKRQVLPNIQLSVLSQSLNATKGNVAGSGTDTSIGFSNRIQLSLSVPIFTGFSNTYTIRQAEAQKQAAAAQYDTLAQQIDLQVWQYYFNLQTAAKSIESSRALLISAKQAAEQAYGQYKSGVGNILTVLTTQATASSARTQWIQAKLNWYTALAQFSATLGNLIRER
jgi:outer membrane protein TolC